MADTPNYQYPEDSPHISGAKGTAALVVRKDTGATLADTDGDYTLLQVDASGNLRIAGTVDFTGGTLNNGAETTVGTTAVQILAANTSRKILVVQNVGGKRVRVGTTGVTNITGIHLFKDGGALILDSPHCPTNAIFAILDMGEGSGTTKVFATEITT